MRSEPLASVDGRITPTAEAVIPLADDGLYRGDGAFEVIRLYGGRPFALAEHLERSGARFYGAYWCPKCNEQKRAFGGAARRLPYVECSPNGRNGGIAFDCASAGIYSYPTWVIGGRQYTGVLSPERLAAMSGYDLERAPEQ